MTATSDRQITPSKITAWPDCDHDMTLRRAVDAGQLSEASSPIGSFARLRTGKLLDTGVRDVDEMKVISALCAFAASATAV